MERWILIGVLLMLVGGFMRMTSCQEREYNRCLDAQVAAPSIAFFCR